MFVILGLKTNKEAQLKELRRQLKSSATNAAPVPEGGSGLCAGCIEINRRLRLLESIIHDNQLEKERKEEEKYDRKIMKRKREDEKKEIDDNFFSRLTALEEQVLDWGGKL